MALTELPRITIVTPSYQQAPFLERTIRSVLDQGYPNLEYFVHDGGSTDGSVEIIERYAAQLSAWRSGPDGGQSDAILSGWERATGDVVAWLNSDDFLLPGTLDFIGNTFANRPDETFVYGQVELVDTAGRPLGRIGEPFRRRTLLFSRNVVPQPAAFVRRSALVQAGSLDRDLHFAMDLDLWLRLAQIRAPVYVDRPLAGATVHAEAKTTRDRDPMARERQAVRMRHARGAERAVVALQPVASAAYWRLPEPARSLIDRVRPRRHRADRPGG